MSSQLDKFISGLFYGRDDLEDSSDNPQQKILRLFASGNPDYANQGVELADLTSDFQSANFDWAYPIYKAFAAVAQSVPKLVRQGYPHEERDGDVDFNEEGGRSARSKYNDPRISLMVAFHGLTKKTYPQWWIDPNTIPHRVWPPYKFRFDETRLFVTHGLPLMEDGQNYAAGWDRLDELARLSGWVNSPEIDVKVKAYGLDIDAESALYRQVKEEYLGEIDFDTEYQETSAYGPIEPQERSFYLTDSHFYPIQPKKYIENKWNSEEAEEAFMEHSPPGEEDSEFLYKDGELIYDWKNYAFPGWIEAMEDRWEEDFKDKLYRITANVQLDLTCHNCLPQNGWFAMLPANWDDGYISSVGSNPFPYTGAEVLTFTFLTAAFMRIFADVPPDTRKQLKITDAQLIVSLMPFVFGMNVKPARRSDLYPSSFSTTTMSHTNGLANSIEEWFLSDLMDPWQDEWIENMDFDIEGFNDFTLP
jgi:hypothetical protein